MKITKRQLKQIIKEEIEKELEEGAWGDLGKVAGIGVSPEEKERRTARMRAFNNMSEEEQEAVMDYMEKMGDIPSKLQNPSAVDPDRPWGAGPARRRATAKDHDYGPWK